MKVELIEEKKCSATYRIDGTTVLIWTIVGGQIATSLENYNQTARWNNIPHGESAWTPTKLSWIEDQDGLKSWLKAAIRLQAEIDSRPIMKHKEAFRLKDEIIIVNVDLNQRYVSISADFISPISEHNAIEFFGEDFDGSLYWEVKHLDYNGETYLYEFTACGQWCDEIRAVSSKFNRLLELHLKDDQESYMEAVNIVRGFGKIDLGKRIETIAKQIIDDK